MDTKSITSDAQLQVAAADRIPFVVNGTEVAALEADGTGSGLLSRNPAMRGTYYYVDPTDGNDSHTGLSWTAAFKTLQAAIDACTNYAGDVITCAKGTETVTATVAFNKDGIIVRPAVYGMDSYNMGEHFTVWADAAFTDGPVATITKPCTIAGLGFSSRWAAGSAVYVNGEGGGFAGGFAHLLGCRFPGWGGETYGVDFDAGAYNLVEACHFDAAFTAAVYFGPSASNNPAENEVRGCRFTGVTYAIEHAAAGTPGTFLYKGNVVVGGKFLNVNAAACNGLVADNWFGTATNATTYSDTVVALKALGVTFSGNHYSE